jgi:phosphoserine phosphatase
MTKILLIRHGHVEGIKPERFRGREPLELTDQGRGEAAAVANRIAGRWQPRSIYKSPLSRCVKTAEAVAEACAVAAQICDDLNDTDYGAWQFKTFHQAKAENPTLFAAWFATPHLVRFRRKYQRLDSAFGHTALSKSGIDSLLPLALRGSQ